MKNDKMLRIFKSKKAVNDISILTGIILIFFLAGVTIPHINEAFGTGFDKFDVDNIKDTVKEDAKDISTINAATVIFTVFKLAIWDFGNTLQLPFWLDAIFSVFTVIFIITLARNIWIGGGG